MNLTCDNACFQALGHGLCTSNLRCVCSPGFFGDDCGYSVLDLYQGGWYAFLVLTSVAYAACLLACCYIFYNQIRGRSQAPATFGDTVRCADLEMSVCILICLDTLVYASADAGGFHDYGVPLSLRMFAEFLILPLVATKFYATTFAWVRVYTATVVAMREATALNNMRQHLNVEVTLDTVQQKLSKRCMWLRNVMIASNAIDYCFFVASVIASGMRRESSEDISRTWLAYYGCMYTVYGVTCIAYCIRFMRLVDKKDVPVVRAHTRAVVLHNSVFMVGYVLVGILILLDTPGGYIAGVSLFRISVLFLVVVSLYGTREANSAVRAIRDLTTPRHSLPPTTQDLPVVTNVDA